MDTSMIVSLRERATARTRSGDVSPEPPPFFDSKWRVVRRVSRRLGRGAGPARAAKSHRHVHRRSLLTFVIDLQCKRSLYQ